MTGRIEDEARALAEALADRLGSPAEQPPRPEPAGTAPSPGGGLLGALGLLARGGRGLAEAAGARLVERSEQQPRPYERPARRSVPVVDAASEAEHLA